MLQSRRSTRKATGEASAVMCGGLAITYLLLPDGDPIAIYRTAAIGTGLTICLGLLLEARDVRSLIRVDLFMIVALFGLTLMEFLFPQGVLNQVTSKSALQGVEALFLGFGGIIIGRNITIDSRIFTQELRFKTLS